MSTSRRAPLAACLTLLLACVACVPQPAAPVASTPPAILNGGTSIPKATPAPFGAPTYPQPRPQGTRPPEATAPPSAEPTPEPTPTPRPTPTPEPGLPPPPSAEPTLPPPPGIKAYDLPTLGVNVTTMHGGKGSGDNEGPTTLLRMNGPVGVAIDEKNIVYIADSRNNKIRRSEDVQNPDGTFTRQGTTYAGTGVRGYTDGAGRVAASAMFDRPHGVATGPLSSVYVADTGNHCLRRIYIPPSAEDQETPQCFTIAGDRTAGYKDAAGTDAQFNEPWGVAVDPEGNSYVTDSKNHCVRKVTPAQVVTTLAGTGGIAGHKDGAGKTAQFSTPKGICYDRLTNNLYVCDTDNHCIRKIDSSGRVSTFAGVPGSRGFKNGPGDEALFDTPIGIGVNADGVLYVSDFGNNRLRAISTTREVSNFAGTGTAGELDAAGAYATFQGPQGIVVDSNKDLYLAEDGNHTIRKILLERVVTREFGSSSPGSLDDRTVFARFNNPFGIALGADGVFYVADTGNHTIRKITKAGLVLTFAGKAGEAGDKDGSATEARFDSPRSLCVDAKGNLFVADEGNHQIRMITPDGTVTTVAGSGTIAHKDGKGQDASFNIPRGICVARDGTLFVAEFGSHRIRKIVVGADGIGTVTTYAGDGSSGLKDGEASGASFSKPSGVAVDADGRVFVADYGNNAIRVVLKDDTEVLKVGTLAGGDKVPGYKEGSGTAAKFNDPYSLIVDSIGRIFVADYGNCLIRKITPEGNVSTWAGKIDKDTGEPRGGFQDGGASDAMFNSPAAVVIDELGYVYVVDSENNCIRRIH